MFTRKAIPYVYPGKFACTRIINSDVKRFLSLRISINLQFIDDFFPCAGSGTRVIPVALKKSESNVAIVLI